MRFKCYAAIMSADSLHVERSDDQDDGCTGRGNASEASYPWLGELPATDRAHFSRLHRACSIARKHRPFIQRYGTSNRRRRWVSTSTGSKPSWTFPKPCDKSSSLITFMGSTDALLRCCCSTKSSNLSIDHLVADLRQPVRQWVRLIHLPVIFLRLAAKPMRQASLIERLSGNLQVDITRAEDLLGWRPPINVAEGSRRAMLVGAGVE